MGTNKIAYKASCVVKLTAFIQGAIVASLLYSIRLFWG